LISRRLLPAYISSPFIRRLYVRWYKKAAKNELCRHKGASEQLVLFFSLSSGAKSGSLAVGITRSVPRLLRNSHSLKN
jgi:hypothetical protein